jgi:hypothetical protein
MPDLGALTLEHFSGHVGDTFTVGALVDPTGAPATLAIKLAEAEQLGPAPSDDQREPFSLMFTGPMETMLMQGIHQLEHADLGELGIFLVPVQPDHGQARYQAIFT